MLPIESEHSNNDVQSIIEIFRPIRQSIYAILHNLNKQLYDIKKVAEQKSQTIVHGEDKGTYHAGYHSS